MQLDNYIEFTLTVCLSSSTLNTIFYLWGDTGDVSSFTSTSSNLLGSPSSLTLSSGCQQLTTPYISFSQQPNGQNDVLVIGILPTSGNAAITIAVNQSVILGVHIYYYVLIGLISLLGVVIVGGIGVFLYRQRMRNRAGGQPAVPQQRCNAIEHFEAVMPLFEAGKLGSERSVCPICLMQVEVTEFVRRTPCMHVFHGVCIDSWGLKNLSCPVCRTELTLEGLEEYKSGRG